MYHELEQHYVFIGASRNRLGGRLLASSSDKPDESAIVELVRSVVDWSAYDYKRYDGVARRDPRCRTRVGWVEQLQRLLAVTAGLTALTSVVA